MTEVIIYGASDDLIEVEGVIADEFNHYSRESAVIEVRSDGELVAGAIVLYDDAGVWRVESLGEARKVLPSWHPARGEGEPADAHGCPGYSEKIVFDLGDHDPAKIAVTLKEH